MTLRWPLLLALLLLCNPLWADDECAAFAASIGEPEYVEENAPDTTRLCREGYVLSHNNEHKTPDWVLELLTAERFTGPGDREEQGNPFRDDPDLSDEQKAFKADYAKSGFDRGHMSPAADNKFTENAMLQSFYLSNMAPQVGLGLNRGIWADLENLVRDWTCDHGKLITISGPIYGEKIKSIGDSAVAIPESFYKIVIDPKREMAQAFVLPNKKIDKQGKKPATVLAAYRSSIADIEEQTGIYFLPHMRKRAKDVLERGKSTVWPVYAGCQ